MSMPSEPGSPTPTSGGWVDAILVPEAIELGGFSVRRALPAPARAMVGPFIFFDHIGPASFGPGEGIQVRPHPHIGLSTLTYLFEGEIVHRDSLGFVQPIRPGAVNLMTAGRGIVHSERSPESNDAGRRLHGIQCWMALPDADEECEPAFVHHAATELPEFMVNQTRLRLIVGEAYGHRSPVAVHSAMLYLEARLPAGAVLTLPATHPELAFYVVSGAIQADQHLCTDGVMAVTRDPTGATIRAERDTHLILIGGDPVGERHIWWNFVSSSESRIEQAKDDWRNDRYDAIPGETEFIPLPE